MSQFILPFTFRHYAWTDDPQSLLPHIYCSTCNLGISSCRFQEPNRLHSSLRIRFLCYGLIPAGLDWNWIVCFHVFLVELELPVRLLTSPISVSFQLDSLLIVWLECPFLSEMKEEGDLHRFLGFVNHHHFPFTLQVSILTFILHRNVLSFP